MPRYSGLDWNGSNESAVEWIPNPDIWDKGERRSANDIHILLIYTVFGKLTVFGNPTSIIAEVLPKLDSFNGKTS